MCRRARGTRDRPPRTEELKAAGQLDWAMGVAVIDTCTERQGAWPFPSFPGLPPPLSARVNGVLILTAPACSTLAPEITHFREKMDRGSDWLSRARSCVYDTHYVVRPKTLESLFPPLCLNTARHCGVLGVLQSSIIELLGPAARSWGLAGQ
ncbi:hypothetical protein FB451DRAFT_670028 [Mycena latifolia]|nr:hypothetical protein FB451DRAFT_670028 [Mycena latifolia]